MWKVPNKWVLPKNEYFYEKHLEIFEHTINEYNYVTPHLTEQRTAIDIGAHIGSTTVRYAKDFKKVVAIEPVYINELSENTKHLDNVQYINHALSDVESQVEMVRKNDNSGMTLVMTEETRDYINSRSWWVNQGKVSTKTLDSYNIEQVDFIKIDTENYVLPILKGAIETLKNNNPVFIIKDTKKNFQMLIFITELGKGVN